MMDNEGLKTVVVLIVAADVPRPIHVLKVAFDAYAAFVEAELELPEPEANLLKSLTDQELQFRRRRKWMHAALIECGIR